MYLLTMSCSMTSWDENSKLYQIKSEVGGLRRINALVVRSSEKNVKVDYQLSNELKMNRIRYR